MTEPVAEPRLSATVLLVRDDPGLQVLMVKRHYEIDFAAGALVFPGGKANDEDSTEAWTGQVDGDYKGEQRAARIAAVREAYEESGLLLARHNSASGDGGELVGQDVAEQLGPHRSAIDKRDMSFLELMQENDLVLALDQLIHFGHWITPEMMPKRFDTHFYLAKAPAGQMASHDGRETTEAVWLGPNAALEMEQAGKATIIFPTRMNLVKLGRQSMCDDAVEAFASQTVVTVLPVIGKDGDGHPCLNIPAEADYGQTQELLERIKV